MSRPSAGLVACWDKGPSSCWLSIIKGVSTLVFVHDVWGLLYNTPANNLRVEWEYSMEKDWKC